MEKFESNETQIDPRQEALEEAAFTVWQFAAAFQDLPFANEMTPMRPPEGDEWRRAAELSETYDITPEELAEEARSYFQETLEVLFPDGDLTFFLRIRQEAIRKNRQRRANFAIKGAIERRVFRDEST